ncbi:unnamed protein product [Hermetia illucens]|uniref:Uncharacterized protein n=1 Tax=Hermetia illucens TaxID=343691 RepID=A0A7R8UZJ8_HERIL|nr:uncharacterized protein LOC119657247 [Hermetia illucens]XP_037919993.1 uncharacterized protein LOC119657247 [Hermetia illucens]XP_037919994.1 uncharacterized protein LOC119657247 [Hermetia illucens]XP_037919995.1 uncharacterized protein LOC119657247 [Hermetia illucens]CAD7089907.1 unnamed protein product [Hermetia illucens]
MNKCLVTSAYLLLLCGLALATPMLYKKNSNDKFEADLVPVSSTVIPLSVIEVSYGKNGMPSEEYKIAYLKKLRKKVKHEDDFEDPDTLITIKKKHHEKKGKEVTLKGV